MARNRAVGAAQAVMNRSLLGGAPALALGAGLTLICAAQGMAQTAQPRPNGAKQGETQILGERPEPPRRAEAPRRRLAAPAGAPSVGVPRRRAEPPPAEADGPGLWGWVGGAAIVAALAMLAAGLAGAFDRASARIRRARGGARLEPLRRTADARKTAAASPEADESRGVVRDDAARGKRLDVADAVPLLALIDELSPRRRRAAALSYGARDLPPAPRREPAQTNGADKAGNERGAHASCANGPLAEPSPLPPGAPRREEEDPALAELADRSAELARRIRDFSRTKAARRNRDGRARH